MLTPTSVPRLKFNARTPKFLGSVSPFLPTRGEILPAVSEGGGGGGGETAGAGRAWTFGFPPKHILKFFFLYN
jgi:hypothetical protein